MCTRTCNLSSRVCTIDYKGIKTLDYLVNRVSWYAYYICEYDKGAAQAATKLHEQSGDDPSRASGTRHEKWSIYYSALYAQLDMIKIAENTNFYRHIPKSDKNSCDGSVFGLQIWPKVDTWLPALPSPEVPKVGVIEGRIKDTHKPDERSGDLASVCI